MCVVELIYNLIRQLRVKSLSYFSIGKFMRPDANTRRKQLLMLKLTYNGTKIKRRSWENSIVRTYNWLRMLDSISPDVKNLTGNTTKVFYTTSPYVGIEQHGNP